jgi:hypothetical protein
VTRPGEWGRWVDGGGWLHIDGTAVDWLYRDLDRVRKSWEDAQAGRYDFHFQIGHPFGVPDFMYAGEVALGVVLADPSGELGVCKQITYTYAFLGVMVVLCRLPWMSKSRWRESLPRCSPILMSVSDG